MIILSLQQSILLICDIKYRRLHFHEIYRANFPPEWHKYILLLTLFAEIFKEWFKSMYSYWVLRNQPTVLEYPVVLLPNSTRTPISMPIIAITFQLEVIITLYEPKVAISILKSNVGSNYIQYQTTKLDSRFRIL